MRHWFFSKVRTFSFRLSLQMHRVAHWWWQMVEWFRLIKGDAVAQSVKHATPDEEVMDSIPALYWLGRCQYNVTSWDRSHDLPALSRVWQQVKLSDVSPGTRPRYSLVVHEDVKKPTNQTNKIDRKSWGANFIFWAVWHRSRSPRIISRDRDCAF